MCVERRGVEEGDLMDRTWQACVCFLGDIACAHNCGLAGRWKVAHLPRKSRVEPSLHTRPLKRSV